MFQTSFNRYKAFYIPKTPIQPAKLPKRHGRSITNGFEFIPWDSSTSSTTTKVPESPEPEHSSGATTSTEPSTEEKFNEQEDELDDDCSNDTKGKKSKNKKLSKEEKKKLKQDKKLARQEASRAKKKQEEAEVLASGSGDNDDDDQITKSGASRAATTNHYIDGNIRSSTKEKLHYLKSLQLTISNTKNPRVLEYHDITIRKEDIFCLGHDEWLNDNNLSYIYERLEKVPLHEYIHEQNSQLLNTKLAKRWKNSIVLLKPSLAFLLLKFPDPTALQGILPPLELSSFLFVPINDNDDVEAAEGGSHWSLVVVSLLEGVAYFYDTLAEDEDEGNYEESMALVTNLNFYLEAVGGGHKKVVGKVVKTPLQINGSDCGVHVLQITAILLARIMECGEDGGIPYGLEGLELSALDGRIWILRDMLEKIREKRKSGALL
ncbi:hypothetical protein DASC09_033900 [Saccharomycopsis crataegensis]|uniref:Ubiquitin-like protease family profile domain-containing protein n=1 Tax=Saccharomycopsis crataegensis TaxID=43959 RepID=A0AAV5QP20_9ASCO|nr:hypothetical protein DASC09_033900 [Saccharomycopsis crataegensis]